MRANPPSGGQAEPDTTMNTVTRDYDPVVLAALDDVLRRRRTSMMSMIPGKVGRCLDYVSSSSVHSVSHYKNASPNKETGQYTRVLVDSGNLVFDCISKKMADKLGLKVKPLPKLKQAKAANKSTMPILGVSQNDIYVQFREGGRRYKFQPLIVAGLSHDVNLSSAFLARHNCVLHCRSRLLKFPQENIPLFNPLYAGYSFVISDR